MSYGSWAQVTAAVLAALGDLAEGDFFILGEQAAYPLPRRRLFGRRPAAERYVQVIRLEGLFTAECVGARSLGGTWQMDDATITRLRAMGWRSPDESKRGFESETPNFDMYVGLDAAPTLAELLAESLEALGARPEDVTLQTTSS